MKCEPLRISIIILMVLILIMPILILIILMPIILIVIILMLILIMLILIVLILVILILLLIMIIMTVIILIDQINYLYFTALWIEHQRLTRQVLNLSLSMNINTRHKRTHRHQVPNTKKSAYSILLLSVI